MSAGAQPNSSSSNGQLTCVVCSTSWPQHLTMRYEDKVLCCPCYSKLRDEALAREAEKKKSGHHVQGSPFVKLKTVMWFVIGIGLVGFAAYAGYLLVEATKDKDKPVAPLVTTTDIGSALVKSSLTLKSGTLVTDIAFFAKSPQGPVAVVPAVDFKKLAATHNEPLPPTNTQVVSLIQKWELNTVLPVPKIKLLSALSQPMKAIEVVENPFVNGDRRIWQLKVKGADSITVPVAVLDPQAALAEKDQPVRLVRLVTVEGNSTQQYITGVVDSVFLEGLRITINLNQGVPAQNIIGSPVINDTGELIGVVDGLGERLDAGGSVKFVDVMSVFELFGTTPPKSDKPKPATPVKAK